MWTTPILWFLLFLSFKDVYTLLSYVCEWHNFSDNSYMFDLVQTFSNLFFSIIHIQTCSNLTKLDQTCFNLFKLVPKFSNLVRNFPNILKSVQTFSNYLNFFNHVQTCPNLSKLAQTYSKVVQSCKNCPNLFKSVQTYSNCLNLFKLV